MSKVTLANLCKPFHNVIIVPVSSDPFNLKTVERKEKTRKIEDLENVKSFFDEIKAFFIIFEMLSFGKI